MNGIPVNDPSFSGAFDLRLLPLEQIERIEIVKGAQSTLYGSDAAAGVVNIITKKGANKPAQLYGSAAIGSYHTNKINMGVSGSADKASYNAGFTHYERKGISEALDTTTEKNFDTDGYSQNAFNFTGSSTVAGIVNVKPFFRYSYLKSNYDDGSFTDAANKSRSSLLSGGVQAEVKYAHGAVIAQYSYDEMTREYNSTWGKSEYSGNNKLAEVYSFYNINDHLRILAGLDTRKQKNLDSFVTITSPYISLFITNIKGFYIEAGGRYNHHSKYGDNYTYSFNPAYIVRGNTKIFANIASAFRAPGISELYGIYGANPGLKPEKSSTWEAGFQTSAVNDKFEIRAVYFKRKIKDVITYTSRYENFDLQNDHGVEVEPAIHINEKLHINLYYAFTDGEVTRRSDNKDTSYYNLTRRPKHSFGGTIGYQFTKNLFLSTNLYNYGKRTDLDFANWPAKQVTLKSYFLWNAYAEYGIGLNSIKLFVDVKNILDQKYAEVYGYSTQGFNLTGGVSFKL
jgi:vitamin B12 transporter